MPVPLFARVSMERIQNDNCRGMCAEHICSERYTHFCNLTLNGLKLHIALCEKHAEQFEKNGWKKTVEVKA